MRDPGALNKAADILKAAAPKSATLKPSGSVDTKQLHAAAETLNAAAPKPAALKPGTEAPSTKVTRAETEKPEDPAQAPAISVKA